MKLDIPLHFKFRDFIYDWLESNGEWNIYKQTSPATKFVEEYIAGYEVVRFTVQEEDKITPIFTVKAGITYPTTNKWGIDGFTVFSIEAGREKIKKLLLEARRRAEKREREVSKG